MIADTTMMMAMGLTAKEEAKFDGVQDQLSAIFTAAGKVIRFCRGDGEGENRMIHFAHGSIGTSLVSISSSRFLELSVEELIFKLENCLSGQ